MPFIFHCEILKGKISSGYAGPHVVLDAVKISANFKRKKRKTFSTSVQISKSLKKLPSTASTALMRSQKRTTSLELNVLVIKMYYYNLKSHNL